MFPTSVQYHSRLHHCCVVAACTDLLILVSCCTFVCTSIMPISSSTITPAAGRHRDERRDASVLARCLRQISDPASRPSFASEAPLIRPSAAFTLFVCLLWHDVKFPCFVPFDNGDTLGCRCAKASHPSPSHHQGWTCCAFSPGMADCLSHWLLPLASRSDETAPPRGLLLTGCFML